jgi:hypothetical protein
VFIVYFMVLNYSYFIEEIKLNVKKLTKSFQYTLPVNTTDSTNIVCKTGGRGEAVPFSLLNKTLEQMLVWALNPLGQNTITWET